MSLTRRTLLGRHAGRLLLATVVAAACERAFSTGPVAPVAVVVVTPASGSVLVKATLQLTATPQDANGSPLSGRTVSWSSDTPGTASVDSTGLVTGVAAGSATVTATSEGKDGTSSVTVMTVPVASVTVSPLSADIVVGGMVQLFATPKDANGNPLGGHAVIWASSNAAVAGVNTSGLVTGVAAGAAMITATSEGKSSTSTITVGADTSSLVTDPTAVFSEPTVSKPGYLAPITPQPFGTMVTRIAGDNGTSFAFSAGDLGTWGTDVRHHYSKDQPWSADNSLIALQNNGSPSVVYLDGATYQPVRGECPNYSLGDDRWHPSPAHPHERINVNGNQLTWFDVVTCTPTRSWMLPFSVNGFGSGEGNPSLDGRFAALADATRMFVVDMEGNHIGPAVDVSDCGLSSCSIDWVSISPSGKYAVVSYDGDYPRVYDVNPTTLALTARPMPQVYSGCHGTAERGFVYDLGHADMALNPFDGNEDMLIGQEHCGNRGKVVAGILVGGVMMTRLRDGAITALTTPTNEAYPHHISARAYDRPGWVYVSYYNSAGQRFNDEIVAIRMDGQAVERLAHKHSAFSGCYRCESHAVPSRDGLRVLWASNWVLNGDGASSVIQAYVVDTRPDR
jgi:Bacterial Ig-like domain (group 2)